MSIKNNTSSLQNILDTINNLPESGSGLPEVTVEDNNKSLKVVDGEWAVESLSYNDLSDKPTLGALASKDSISKSDVGLGNVENKSSATIRGELTKENVTTALGYTPPTTNITYNEATTTTAGLMSAADKAKLDALNGTGGGSVEGAVLYTQQSLTDEQKAQARANIGAAAVGEGGNQEQINITGAASTIVSENLTADKALISDSNGKVAASETISVADLNKLTGIASNLGEDYTISDAINNMNLTTDSRALTWDGVVGDKTTVTVSEEAESQRAMFVHITDELPNKELFMELGNAGVAVKVSTIEGFSMTIRLPFLWEEDGNACSAFKDGLGIFITYVDNYTISGELTFPKKGIYFTTMESYAPGLGDSDWIPIYWTSAANLPGASFSSGGSDKYFETKTVTTNFGETITWDGVVRDAPQETAKDAFGEGSGVDITLYRISSSIPPKEAFDGATITIKNLDGTEETVIIQLSDLNDSTDADGNVTGYQKSLEFYVVTKPTRPTGVYVYKIVTPDGETYPTSITIPGFSFDDSVTNTVIKTEYLPEALRFGEISSAVGRDTLTWDGNTDGVPSIMGMVYKASEATPTVEDLQKGFTIVVEGITDTGEIRTESFTITPEDIENGSSVIVVTEDGLISILNGIVAIAPTKLSLTEGDEVISVEPGTYVFSAEGVTVKSFTINGYKDFKATKIVKIDPKYLPEGFGGGGNANMDEVKAYVDSAIEAAIGAAISASY